MSIKVYKLFEELAEYSKEHPDLRFGQILYNLGFDVNSPNYIGNSDRDIFYLPDEISKKMVDLNGFEMELNSELEGMEGYKLCYVNRTLHGDYVNLYFTSKELEDQWGDDWDDVPYEHNAGRPYTPCWHNERGSSKYPCDCEICQREWNEDGTPKWEVYTLAVKSDVIKLPAYEHYNSPFSVKELNIERDFPWIRFKNSDILIYAGEDIKNVANKIYETDSIIISLNKYT